MTSKHYCSTICKAACCKVRPPFVSPAKCPQLGEDSLCRIYKKRLGFTFTAFLEDGSPHPCSCHKIEDVLESLPLEMREKCCYYHPELLNASVA